MGLTARIRSVKGRRLLALLVGSTLLLAACDQATFVMENGPEPRAEGDIVGSATITEGYACGDTRVIDVQALGMIKTTSGKWANLEADIDLVELVPGDCVYQGEIGLYFKEWPGSPECWWDVSDPILPWEEGGKHGVIGSTTGSADCGASLPLWSIRDENYTPS